MQNEINNLIISRLAPSGFTARQDIESRYPERQLQDGALVVRSAPSPTGFVHVGTIYMSLLNKRFAHQTGGVYILRLEDTDKKREIEGGLELINNALLYYGLSPDEGPNEGGAYGPYVQSQRSEHYLSYALSLLEAGRAYACFATEDELKGIYDKQVASKVRPGYRGEYAIWRNKPDSEVLGKLKDNLPFVLRFKSSGSHDKRVAFKDQLKGLMELPENDLDVPLIKSDGLPTYHLAHVVDDYLMRVNLVLRGDEWLSSTPLHLELCQALGIPTFNYAHFAPISVLDNGAKRKLSKRKDPEADILHWQAMGYPPESVLEYLTTLANSNFEHWRQEHHLEPLENFELSLAKLAMSRAPLLDIKKLDDVSRNVISNFPQEEFESKLKAWVEANHPEFAQVLSTDPTYTSKVLSIERGGHFRRKDLARWDQAAWQYGYFFDEIYNQQAKVAINEELAGVDYLLRRAVCDRLLSDYEPTDDQPTWFNKFKKAAADCGFALDSASYKSNPDKFKGNLAEFARIVRIQLTGRNQTPDLYLLMQVLGPERIKQRFSFES